MASGPFLALEEVHRRGILTKHRLHRDDRYGPLVDAYLGSFSFINKDSFKALLQQVGGFFQHWRPIGSVQIVQPSSQGVIVKRPALFQRMGGSIHWR